jgi:hypothetical protein
MEREGILIPITDRGGRVIYLDRDIKSYRVNNNLRTRPNPELPIYVPGAWEGVPPSQATPAADARAWLRRGVQQGRFNFITEQAVNDASDREILAIARNQGWGGERPPWEAGTRLRDPNRPIDPSVIAAMRAEQTGQAPAAAPTPTIPAAIDPRMAGFTSDHVRILAAQAGAPSPSPTEANEIIRIMSRAIERLSQRGANQRNIFMDFGTSVASLWSKTSTAFWKNVHMLNLINLLWTHVDQRFNTNLNLPAAAGAITGKAVS